MFTSIPSLDSVVQCLLPAFVVPNMLLVTSRSPSERRAAWELGLAGDAVIREIKLDATFDKVLQQATTDHTNDTNGMFGFVQSMSFVVSSDFFWSAFGSLDA